MPKTATTTAKKDDRGRAADRLDPIESRPERHRDERRAEHDAGESRRQRRGHELIEAEQIHCLNEQTEQGVARGYGGSPPFPHRT